MAVITSLLMSAAPRSVRLENQPELRYTAHAQKCKTLLQWTESLKCNDIEIFGCRCKMNVNAEF